jgi:hypothetical protein
MGNDSKIINLFNYKKDKNPPKEIPKEINITINIVNGQVVIAFREPVKAIRFTRQQTINLANVLISLACDKTVV